MLREWLTDNKLQDVLIEISNYTPYPKSCNRVAWQQLHPNLKNIIISNGEFYLNYDYPSLPATLFMAAFEEGDRVAYEIPHFKRREALRALVLAECLEYKGRFIRDIINGVWCICEESFWGISAHNGPRHSDGHLPDIENIYVDLFSAETGGLFAHILYLLGDKLDEVTPTITRRMELEIERRVKVPVLTRYDFGWMAYFSKHPNNWNPWICANVLSVFLLCERSESRRVKGIKRLMEMTDKFIDNYGEDGGCDEGTSYWNVAGGAMFDFLEQLYLATNGKADFYNEPLIKAIGQFIYRSHISEGYYINFADGSAIATIDPDMIYRYATRINDDKLKDLAVFMWGKKQAERISFEKKAGAVPEGLRRELPRIFNYSELCHKKSSAPLIKDMYLKDIEVMAARQSEGCDKGLYLAAKGAHNDESHNHNDIGSFIVYLNGKPALIDVGVASYTMKTFSSERYSIWTMQTAYHNAPTVNGYMQKDGREFTAENVVYNNNEDISRLTMNIERAYPKDAGIASYKREFEFNRTDKNIRISDVCKFASSGDNNCVAFNFISVNKPSVISGGELEILVGENDVLCITLPKNIGKTNFYHQDTTDKRLAPVWGENGIYRTEVCYDNLGESYEFNIEIFEKK